jgi:hypothetical protein
LDEVEGLTAIGAAGALAALDLLRIDDMIADAAANGRHFTPLSDAVRRYVIEQLDASLRANQV